MIRAFVGLQIPAHVGATLVAAQGHLPCGHIQPPENFHVTLAFLGEHPEPLIEDVHILLQDVQIPSFQIEINGMGMFGTSPPRLVYAAVAPSAELSRLRKKIARIAREAGIALAGERYVPHVTLARFGRDVLAEDAARLHRTVAEQSSLTTEPFDIRSFALFRSTLGKHAPTYDVLADYPLASDAPISAI